MTSLAILQNLSSLILLLSFFTVMGLGVTQGRWVKNNLALVPVIGYAAVIGLSYFISASIKVTGTVGFGIAALLLLVSFLVRIRHFSGVLAETKPTHPLYLCLCVAIIPLISVLLPAMLNGFHYFYGYVNYDFFFNSQDSVYLQTHDVIAFNKRNLTILPLDWSSDFSGRIAVALIGSFFPKVLSLDTLAFNSLLLNTIVVLFALAISAFCKSFFNMGKKATLLAVFCAVLSGSYVQAYCYYVLGQISVMPVFIVYCIFLKEYLDSLRNKEKASPTWKLTLILAILLNVLFILYAIMCVFAMAVTAISFIFTMGNPFKKTCFTDWFRLLTVVVGLFFLSRIFILPETFAVIESWVSLSHKVAGLRSADFIVFSDYLTSNFLALLFSLVTYPSANSLLAMYMVPGTTTNMVTLGLGVSCLIVTLWVLFSYARTGAIQRSARAIVIALFIVMLTLACYFFHSLSAYGIYKLQTWFIPIFITLYVYYILYQKRSILSVFVKLCCVIILALNISSGLIYLNDFFVTADKQHFVNAHGVTGNKDILDIATHITDNHLAPVALYLNNGLETAWFANLLRATPVSAVIHNTQPLMEVEMNTLACSKTATANWPDTGVMIVPNPGSALAEIGDTPEGVEVLYQNKSYAAINPAKIQSFIYFGRGAYPPEHYKGANKDIPEHFRWIEKGAEVFIYSDRDKVSDIQVEIMPGYVDNKQQPRQIILKTAEGSQTFVVKERTLLTMPHQSLHKGVNCLYVESPDKVTREPTYGALIRPGIPLDPRFTNFAISHVGLKKA